jgi:hypothetical protein
MATPVVTVAAGGLPVVDVTATTPKFGLPVTEALNGRGTAVTKVAARGMPVTYSTVADWPPPVPPFTPASLTGLIGWWDTSVYASMTFIGGTDINTMADQSGTGNTQSAFNAYPFYSATGLNSRPAMLLNSGTKALHKTSFALGTGNTLTVFCLATLDSVSTGSTGRLLSYRAPGSTSDADNNGSFRLTRDGTNNGLAFFRNGTSAIKAMAANATFRCIATIDAAGVMTIYIDGAAVTGGTRNAAFVSGGELAIGCQAIDWNGGWRGAISEIGIATGFTSSTDAVSLDANLKTKWGL